MDTVYSNRPAEKILFRELFRNVPTVQRNGGTLIGSPIVRDGVTLDGSTQYVDYIIPRFFQNFLISFVCEFQPNFAADSGTQHFLFDATPSLEYGVAKTGTNALQFFIGGSVINILLAAYQAYWNVGERNILVGSFGPAGREVWLNANLIYSAATYNPTAAADLRIGARANATNKFDGVINSLSIHSCLMTQEDVDAIQDNSLFTYMNKSDVWLDMAEAIIDGSNDRTLDKSRNGQVTLLGDGAGTGTPTWESPGFTFDDVNDYLTLPTDPTGTFTVAWKRRNETTVFESDLTTWNLIKTSGDFAGLLDYLAVFPFTLSPIQERDLNQMLGVNI